MSKIRISQSLIKAFLDNGNYRDTCYKRIKATRIDRSVEDPPSLTQLKGLHFETLVLGGSAGNKKWTLPRKQNGEKTAAEERIDIQALKFRQTAVKNMMSIMPGINTQVKVYKEFNEYVILEGEIDIFPTPMLYNGTILRTVCIDLKLTGDLDNDFGDYAWARVENMDHTQLYMYNYIIKDFDVALNKRLNPELMQMGIIRREILPDFENVPMFYWVFEHGKNLRNQFFRVNIDSTRTAELHERIRKVIEIIVEEDNDPDGWKASPEFNECKNCPLNFMNGGVCEEAQTIKEI